MWSQIVAYVSVIKMNHTFNLKKKPAKKNKRF